VLVDCFGDYSAETENMAMTAVAAKYEMEWPQGVKLFYCQILHKCGTSQEGYGGEISVIFCCHGQTTIREMKYCILHNTAGPKQWTVKWPYIAN